MIPEKARETLELALEEGGKVLLSLYGWKGIKAVVKENISSVLTEADVKSEKVILEILEGAEGDYNIITEESGFLDRGSEYTWVVDPLDGTSNYAAALPWFGVIITLFHHQEPCLGGMYLPLDEDLYLAEQGKGAWKNGKKLNINSFENLEGRLVSYSFDYSEIPGKTESEMEILERLSRRVRNIRSTNSLIDFCYLADGRLGAAINQTTKIWDIAAAWLLIRESGGTVSDIHGNEIIFRLTEDAMDLNYTIAASETALHKELIEIIKPK